MGELVKETTEATPPVLEVPPVLEGEVLKTEPSGDPVRVHVEYVG